MAETRQGNEFNENQILALTQDKAARIWYQMSHKPLFHGIEWNSLSAELVDKHCSLFELNEVAKLSSDINARNEAVTSAIGRDAPRVLHAVYQSLCATTTCGGATQHASIAEEIQKRTLKAAIFKANSYPPSSNSDLILPPTSPGWATHSQLASAEPDFGHDMAQAFVGDGTTQPLHWQTTEAQGCGRGTVEEKPMEEWEGVVVFIRHHFGRNAQRDMVSALHREMVETCCQFFPPSSQQVSEAMQEVVKERHMTWFSFAKYLLRSKGTRPFVFEIPKYTGVSIRHVFKEALKAELGKFWTQLAEEMGVSRTHIDDLQERTDISLLQKINAFLAKYPFPAFGSDADTKDFLVEALERVCLTTIAAAVRRNLEGALPPEDTRTMVHSTRNQGIPQKSAKPCIADNRKSGCPSQTADTSRAHSDSHHVEDPPPPDSPPPEMNQLSQFQSPSVAENFIGPEHTPKNAPSQVKDQSGVGMQTQASQGNHTPDQSNMGSNPLCEMAKKSAVLTEMSSAQQSQLEMASPENTENQHSHVGANSEPVAGVDKSSSSLPPQASTPSYPLLNQPSASASLILPTSQGCIQPNPPLVNPELSQLDTVGGGFQDDIPLHSPPRIVMNEPSNNSEIGEGLPDLESEERDSATARPSNKPAPSNSAQSVHLQSSSQTGSPMTGHKIQPSPSIIVTKVYSPLSNAASHPTQQSAPNEDSMSDDEDDDARSDVTFHSSTSVSAVQTRANYPEQSHSAPNHPPTAHPTQPTTTHPDSSVKVHSHIQPEVVGLPPAEVPSTIKTSGQTYSSAPAVVESVHEADTTASLASSKSVEQMSTVPSGGGSPAVSSALQEMQQQNSGGLGSNQFVSSSLSPRHPGHPEPHGRMPVEGYQREQDSEESFQCPDLEESIHGQLATEDKKMLAYVSRQVAQKWSMLARYAGLEEDDIQEIKRVPAEDRSCAALKKIQRRLTWNELFNIVHKHMHMLNTAAKLQSFLRRPVDALPDLVQKEIDPQQYNRTLLVASRCVSEHWKDLAQYLGVNPYEHWDVLEESSDADEKCHGVLLLWLSNKHATLRQLLEAVEHTSAGAGTLQQLIKMAH